MPKKRKRKSDFEDLMQGIFAIFIFIAMGAALFPILLSSMGPWFVVSIIVVFYFIVVMMIVVLVIKLLEMLRIIK